jgi:hypothetical protein
MAYGQRSGRGADYASRGQDLRGPAAAFAELVTDEWKTSVLDVAVRVDLVKSRID